jgi:LAO/AO transport system kinase
LPEAGDEIQNMKSGLMEVADIFVVNKTDRPDASLFVSNLKQMMQHSNRNALSIPILQTIASQKKGIKELLDAIDAISNNESDHQKKIWFLTEKAIQLIQSKILNQLDRNEIAKKLEIAMRETSFNLYAFLEKEHYL